MATLSRGEPPFFEPGLGELLADALETGRLRFSSDPAQSGGADVHFICVGTPQRQGENAADLRYVDAAVDSLLPHLRPGDVVVGKSTVPVGTAERLQERVRAAQPDATLIWNPEFLREGHAIDDTLRPDRIVYGVTPSSSSDGAISALDSVYASALDGGAPKIVTDLATAQLVKVAANSFLATKISFINAMAELCEATGADVTRLADAIGMDERIGRRFLNAGLGFGGGCLPKDIRAFMARAGELGADQALTFLREVDSINMRRRVRMVDLAREECGGSIVGRKVALLGAAFKPFSDDVRDSPALNVAAQMQLQGASRDRHRPPGHRQRAQEVARPQLRRRRQRRGAGSRAGPAADRVAGVRRAGSPRDEAARRRAPGPGRSKLPRSGRLARRRLVLPGARAPVTAHARLSGSHHARCVRYHATVSARPSSKGTRGT